ncbi:MAG: cation-translocating P-type ATPase [Patescibacteria group bacterium]|jgi:Cd2+/Zn2+-exporting ATPase/Cu+-exporting ATPase
MRAFFAEPQREYLLIGLLAGAFGVDLFVHEPMVLFVIAGLAVIPTFLNAGKAIVRFRINIDTFNAFAVIVSFATGEAYSAGFIALMLTFARLLDWRTEQRTENAVEELMRLKPLTALVERKGKMVEVKADTIKTGDIVLVKSGARVPVDGVIVKGAGHVNEATVTGESEPIEKMAGDRVISSTLVEAGALTVRATQVGKDSTIERMAELMRQAGLKKSHSEKLADRFAMIFLPLVGVLGVVTYIATQNLLMVAALFLIACADDMAVAIPLAMTASLGQAAKRGVIVKGGQALEVLGKMQILVLDKTGTLTLGNLSVRNVRVNEGTSKDTFWKALASAEKYSEHPVGRSAYKEAVRRVGEASDPDEFKLYKGSGVVVRVGNDKIVAGTERLFAELGLSAPKSFEGALGSVFWVAVNGKEIGAVEVADVPRPEAGKSLRRLKKLGVKRVIMFTGDNERVATEVAKALGIKEYRSAMTPEAKLRALEELLPEGPVGMLGDGVNDAPALARADVGIAMGSGGAAVSVEAADIVIMTDDLSRLPEMVELGRRTFAVVKGDAVIWVLSNVIGFGLVFTGIAGPALAAFYNFATDFLPLMNSSRLFRRARQQK